MSQKKIIPFIFLLFTTCYVTIFSQVVYEPLYKDVYNFLGRLSQKGVIVFNDQIRPLSRKYIAEKLIECEQKIDQLTSLETEEFEFFKADYLNEFDLIQKKLTDHLTYLKKDPSGRWRFFSYGSEEFKMNAGIILGYEIGTRDNEKLTHLWNGVYFNGYISDVVGYSFDFRDNTEEGKTIDQTKSFSPVTGVNERSTSTIYPYPNDKIEYEEAKATLATDWKWGSVAIGKDFLEWGYGDNGLLVLSQKAPSFPFIRLDVNPVDWLSFTYIHAWLASDVIDSANIYYTELGSERFSYREKYLAQHTLTLRPWKGFDLSLGESIVYSDKLEILYLIPVTFFRLADHYLSRQHNAAGSNAQFFASVSSKDQLKNTHLYGTLYIDELTLNGLFDTFRQRNQLGFSFGSSITDLPIENLTFKLEYTKMFPFVYRHYISTTTYQSSGYVLGHWMGENADQIYASLNYRFIRGLEASAWFRYIRKGEVYPIERTFEQPQPAFLSGLRTNYTYFGGQVKYEIMHELFVRARFELMKTSAQQEDLSFVDKNLNEFYLAVYYGL
jgi:Capsule assembly protein Wzi